MKMSASVCRDIEKKKGIASHALVIYLEKFLKALDLGVFGFSPEPAERKLAMKRLEQANIIRDTRFKSLRAEYDGFIHKKDLSSARKVVALILELYGEDTKEYEYFRDRLIKIDELLRKNNRRKK